MKKITVIIDKGKTLYAAYSNHINGLHVTGTTVEEVKSLVVSHIEVLRHERNTGEIPAELRGEYEIDWRQQERTPQTNKSRVKSSLASSQELIDNAIDFLSQRGHVFDSTPWVTVDEYCRRFHIDTPETVSEWIQKGFVPPEDVRIIEVPYRIQILRAKKYQIP